MSQTNVPAWAIEATGLSKSFAGPGKGTAPVQAVDRVDLRVAAASIVGLLGPNGAGKTTLFRLLTTLIRPDAGSATIAGFDLTTQPGAVRAHIGLVGQLGGADPEATGQENLILAGRLYGLSRTAAVARCQQLEETFDLAAFGQRIVRTLSGGQRRRLDIAIGLVHQPNILFLDEPTTGLDPQNRANLWDQVRALRDQGTTVVLTTHYLDEADALADQLSILDHGRVIAEGSPADLKQRHQADTLEAVFLELTGRALRDNGGLA